MAFTPLRFAAVLRALGHPVPLRVFDAEGAYVHGVWRMTEPVERPDPIRAVVLAMKTRDLDLYPEGDAASSGISLHTVASLHFADAGGSGPVRQSYVDYQGSRYRVMGSALMSGNTDFTIYHCVRFIR